jgi:copper oxidase (laccase) domain-containing protein
MTQLLTAGLAAQRVDTTDRCTFRDADEFYSHRRDHGLTGRMAAAIAPASAE